MSKEYSVTPTGNCPVMGLLPDTQNCRFTHAPGMPGTFSPPPRVRDPDIHHGTCVTHMPWCMQGSPTSGFLWSRWWGNVPGIPGACTTRNFTYLAKSPFNWELLQSRATSFAKSFQNFAQSTVVSLPCFVQNFEAIWHLSKTLEAHEISQDLS